MSLTTKAKSYCITINTLRTTDKIYKNIDTSSLKIEQQNENTHFQHQTQKQNEAYL